jgi:lysophospholipase L1-like esterase
MMRSAILVLLLASAAMPARAEPQRFMTELSAFAQKEGAQAQAGGSLFIGSSSIRLWDLAAAFPEARVVNHGFGGATVSDVLASYDLVVAGNKPESIIVYVGENDLAEGREPEAVAGDVSALLGRLRKDFPDARIAFLAMKVAPVRWRLRRDVAKVNRMVAAQAGAGFDYVDVARGLLTADRRPDRSLYGADGLHLNAQGYARWNEIVGRYLLPEAPATIATQSAAAP